MESIRLQKRFLEEGGRPASGARVSRYFIARGANVVDARAADIDGDGRSELLAACRDPQCVAVLRSGKPREFREAARFPVGAQPSRIILCNFDGKDGLDIAIVSRWTKERPLTILLGRGDGTFGPPVSCPIPNIPFSTLAADLDRDGRDEVASLGHIIQVVDWTDAGEPRLRPEIKVPDLGNSLAAADFDRDGNVDLAAGCFPRQKGLLWVWWGDGKGGASETSELPCSPAPLATVPADLDGDGDLDLAFNDSMPRVAVAWNDGGREFRIGDEQFPLPRPLVPAASGDLDGDGCADLAFVDGGSGTVFFLLGNRSGKLEPGRPLIPGGEAYCGWAGDLDGDGQADLAIATGRSDGIGVCFRMREQLRGRGEKGAAAGGKERK